MYNLKNVKHTHRGVLLLGDVQALACIFICNLFIMEGVNCFGKKNVQVGKYIIAVLTEILKSKCKTFLKTLRIFNYNRFPSFDWLFNWTELWPTLCTWCLFLGILFFNTFFVIIASKWLSPKKKPPYYS